MEQPGKRLRGDEAERKQIEKGNKLLKKLRDNRNNHLKKIDQLKKELFVPLTDEQLEHDVDYAVRTIENHSERQCMLSLAFALKDKFNKPTYLYLLMYNIREALNSDLRYKPDIDEFEKVFDTFRRIEAKRLALAIAEKIDFPFYDYDPQFTIVVSKSGLCEPPYGVNMRTREGGWSIEVWWGIESE